jgi:6,7-dimethyl-8-ribityllumazine synthase
MTPLAFHVHPTTNKQNKTKQGSTMHFEYICDAVSHQIMRLGVDTGIPVVFGVLTCLTEDQALARAGLPTSDGKNDGHNHGLDWGTTAVEMALLKNKTSFA